MNGRAEKRRCGRTDLMVREVGFGAWGIGAMAGDTPIGWGADDAVSIEALHAAFDRGITFIALTPSADVV